MNESGCAQNQAAGTGSFLNAAIDLYPLAGERKTNAGSGVSMKWNHGTGRVQCFGQCEPWHFNPVEQRAEWILTGGPVQVYCIPGALIAAAVSVTPRVRTHFLFFGRHCLNYLLPV